MLSAEYVYNRSNKANVEFNRFYRDESSLISYFMMDNESLETRPNPDTMGANSRRLYYFARSLVNFDINDPNTLPTITLGEIYRKEFIDEKLKMALVLD